MFPTIVAFNHTYDPEYAEKHSARWEEFYKQQGCDVITEQRTPMSIDSEITYLQGKMQSLLDQYHYVLIACLDEYIFPNPFLFKSLKDFITQTHQSMYTTTGYEHYNGLLQRATLYDKVALANVVPEYKIHTHAKYTLHAPKNNEHLYLLHYRYIP